MEHHAAPNGRAFIVLAGLSLVAIGLAAHGWHSQPYPHHYEWRDAVYVALKTVSTGEPYNEVAEFQPKSVELEISRWLGVVVETSAVALFLLAVFHQRWLRVCALFKRDHIVVVGESHFADKLSEMPGCSIVHLRALGDAVHGEGKRIRLPLSGRFGQALAAAAARHASRIVIAPQSDSDAIGLALLAEKDHGGQVQVQVLVHDYWLSQRLQDIPGAERLTAISEPGLAARDVVRRHPPYLLVQDQGAPRIHALLIGDHDGLEAAMAESILSAGTLTYGKSAFTFVCAKAQAFRERLLDRYPEIETEADLVFLEPGGLRPSEAVGLDFAAIQASGPITAIYSLFPAPAEALACALALIPQARAVPAFKAPIFVLYGGQGLVRPDPGSRLAPLALVPFGGAEATTQACGLMEREADLAEREFHSAYLKFAPKGGDASKPWDQLREEYRVSNRRAVAHIYAKLFDAGFDLRRWMATHDVWRDLPALAPGEALFRNEAERDRLAVLEHDRWIADRRLSGWRYGSPRDNNRKHHPDIKPFEALSVEIQNYDREFIDLIGKLLVRKAGDLARL